MMKNMILCWFTGAQFTYVGKYLKLVPDFCTSPGKRGKRKERYDANEEISLLQDKNACLLQPHHHTYHMVC